MLHRIKIDNNLVIYGNDKFKEELAKAILKEIQEYNTSKSVRHPNAEK